jgi:cyclic pyranopterin phosphate synthase
MDHADLPGAVGRSPVKVNMVVRRGYNEHCVVEMAERFRGRPEILRFIEYMDVGASNGWRREEVVTAAEIRAVIEARWPLQELPARHDGEVASRLRYRDGAGEIGLIHSVSAPFCRSCTRARLSADGQLFTCLFASEGHDLRAVLREGRGEAGLRDVLARVWRARADRYSALRGELAAASAEPRIEMSYIGG